MGMREEFEKWSLEKFGGVGDSCDIFKLDSDGNYHYEGARIWWEAWQEIWEKSKPKWIKCSDRTPGNEDIILRAENASVWIGGYDEECKCFFEYSGECVHDFTDWMHIPSDAEE